MGKRGAWLANLNSDWDCAVSREKVGDEPGWEDGTLRDRVAHLKALREQEPAHARAKISENLTGHPAEERVALIETMGTGLGIEDEEFLEEQLGDRSKTVRRTAARLLSLLPGTRFANRMCDRLRSLVALKGSLFRKTLVVKPPDSLTEDMLRDAIEKKNPFAGEMGDRAWWLMQIVGYTPLSWWQGQFGMRPGELTVSAERTDWAIPLLRGWSEAATRSRDEDWSRALLASKEGKTKHLDWLALTKALPLEERETYAIGLLEERYPQDLLELFDLPWSEKLSRAVVKSLLKRLGSGGAEMNWELRETLKEVASRLAPSGCDEWVLNWPTESEHWDYYLEAYAEFVGVLKQRKAMYEEFQL
jgi:hypothetical protein